MTARQAPDRLASVVAVLIMVVSLLGASFAFMDSQARSRAAGALRRAEAAGVDVLRETVLREREIGQQFIVYGYGNDLAWMATSLDAAGATGLGYAGTLAAAYRAAWVETLELGEILGSEYQLPDGAIEWRRFVEESRRPAYRAVEIQKAHSEVASGWSSKSSKYVTIITILAASLFLLGLTVSVIADARLALVGTGVGLALAAGLWGLAVWSAPVPPVSERAIDAYVDAAVIEYASEAPEDLRVAERRLDDAIAANPRYREAYLARGYARFQLDLIDPAGPRGSLDAAEDFETALDLDASDPIAWSNLGAAWFWLEQYDAAEVATRRALAIDPDEPIMTLNLAILLAIAGDPSYDVQMERAAGLLADMPSWQREAVVTGYLRVLDLAELHRPDISSAADEMHQRLFHLDREISVGRRFFGNPSPAPVAATMEAPDIVLGDDGTTVRLTFEYSGIVEGQRFIYRTFLDGVEREDLSLPAATPWSLQTPDGSAFIDLRLDGGFGGHTLRVELYLEGNLLATGELTVG